MLSNASIVDNIVDKDDDIVARNATSDGVTDFDELANAVGTNCVKKDLEALEHASSQLTRAPLYRTQSNAQPSFCDPSSF